MTIWEQLKEGLFENLGKIACVSGAVTVLIAGSLIIFPPSVLLYGAALVGCGMTCGASGLWYMKEYMEEKIEHMENEHIQDLKEVRKDLSEFTNKKEEEENRTVNLLHFQELDQKVKELTGKVDMALELQRQNNLNSEQGKEEIIARIEVVKGAIDNSLVNGQRLSGNRYGTFRIPQIPTDTTQCQSSQSQLH